jgi:VWFA-related protein
MCHVGKHTVLTYFFLSSLLVTAIFAHGSRAQQSAQPPPPPGQSPEKHVPSSQTPGGVIRSEVNLVVLRAAVINQRGQFITGLPQQSFQVYENKTEQTISVFHQEDAPVTMGLVIDNSSSMRDKRPSVNSAALTLVKASNPQDEAFVVNFSADYHVDTVHDFTSDIDEMKDALARIDSRSITALYDAVIGSIDHLKKGNKDRKVLIAITDGADNASRNGLQAAIGEALRSDALIYTVGVFSDEDRRSKASGVKKARRALVELATATGGLFFFPETPADTETTCVQIARDIRHQYTIAYYSTNAARDGSFRTVHVTVTPPPGYDKLSVRTRRGYYASRGTSGD